MKSQKKGLIITFAVIFLALLTAIITLFVSQWNYNQATQAGAEGENEYTHHFSMIVSKPEDDFWTSVYAAASAQSEEDQAFVEMLAGEYYSSYTMLQRLEIAIASKVDGILIESDGSPEMKELIDQATQEGIPVVTLLRDTPDSSRICYVGISYHQLGQQYAEQVLQLVQKKQSTDSSSWHNPSVTILMGEDFPDSARSVIYPVIREYLSAPASLSATFDLDVEVIDTRTPFKAKENIWNLMFKQKDRDQILVCLDEACSDFTYQVLIDHSQAGKVPMIAFYTGDDVLYGIQKANIVCTAGIDTSSIGQKAVQALSEYLQTGFSSDYYSVDTNIVDKNNVSDYISPGEE